MIIKNNNPRIEPSFSISNRAYRFLWNIIQSTLFRFSPRTFHSFRNLILKIFGAKIGKHVHIYNKVQIWSPKNLIIKNYVAIANDVQIYNVENVKIESFTVVSQGSFLCTASHDYNSKNFQLYAKPIYLKKNVWVCAQSFIHPGVTIEEGIVIGARSVVIKDLKKKWTVYSGFPVKYLAKRNKKYLKKKINPIQERYIKQQLQKKKKIRE
jgi:putative colanic acid biosynthesis acetyltransferase WcaF